MRFLSVIPARGGSKGVPRKNIRLLAGKPLIAHTIEAAKGARQVDRVVVSTDDQEIADISASLGAEVLMRPAELAVDNAPTLPVLQHVVRLLKQQAYAPDAVITLQPTSPLRVSRHIDEAAALFATDQTADSLVSCISVPHIFHPLSVMRRGPEGYLEPYITQTDQPNRRQDKPAVFARNGAAIYITRTERLEHYIFGGRLIAYEMPARESIDIDDMNDFSRAEALLTSAS